jgi:hypothetical protein
VKAVTGREIAWAIALSALLTAGIIGTLLLQTAMDSQARSLQKAQQVQQNLVLSTQQLRSSIDRLSDPSLLAARAKELRMHPQVQPQFLHSK